MKPIKSKHPGVTRALAFAAVAVTSLMALLEAHAAKGPQPTICLRSCWVARAPTCGITQMSSLTRAIVHHTAGAGDYNTSGLADSKAKVRAVQNLHINNGWCDIAYHFVVDKHGNVFEGRSGAMAGLPRGTHDCANNNSFGFNVLGYYHTPYNNVFTVASQNALMDVIAWRMPSGWSPYGSGNYSGCEGTKNVGFLDGHNRVKATACPGSGIYNTYITDNRNGGPLRNGVNCRKNGTCGSGPSISPGPDAASRYPGNIEMFVRTSDNKLKAKVYSGNWSGWIEHANDCTSDPSVVSWDQNRLDVFWRGNNASLMQKTWTAAGGWSSPVSLGGQLIGGPDVCSMRPGRLDVFVRGTDNALHHRSWEGNWSGWASLGGTLTADPSAVSWANNRIDVFVNDASSALNQKVWTSTGGWSGWNQIGGQLVGSPDACSMRPGRLDIFVRGTDNAMHHIAWELQWSGWESLGGVLTSSPGATSWGDNRIDVFVRGGANEIHQKFWTSTGGWSGWVGMGIP